MSKSILCITAWQTTDWFILRCRGRAACRNSSEPDPQQSGYLRILPRKYLSASREYNTLTHLVPGRYITHILSSELCHLG